MPADAAVPWIDAVNALDVSGDGPPTYDDNYTRPDPFAASNAMGEIGALTSLAGTASSISGALSFAAAAKATAKRNALLAQQEAADAIQRGVLPAFRARLQGDALFGRQHAAYGASGVLAGWGSAGDVTSETRIFSAMDEQVIRNNAAREAYMLQTQAVRAQQEGAIAEAQGNQQAEGAAIGGFAALVKTFGPMIIDAALL